MKKVLFLSVIGTISIMSMKANSSELSYDFVQAAYINSDFEIAGTSIDGDGFGVGGSVGIADNFAFVVSYEDLSYDFDLEAESLSFGLNYHAPVSQTTDIVIGVGVINGEVSQPFLGSEDDTGNIVSAGLRSRLNANVEIGASVSRVEIFDDSSTGFSLSLFVGQSDGVQLGVAYGSADDTDTIGVGIRSNF